VLIDSTWGLSTLSWHMQNPLAANFFFYSATRNTFDISLLDT